MTKWDLFFSTEPPCGPHTLSSVAVPGSHWSKKVINSGYDIIIWTFETTLIQIHHPPYSLDLSQCNFFLFPKLKVYVKDKIQFLKGIRKISQLQMISKERFQWCFDQWKTHWNWMPRGLFWRKLMFYLSFVFLFVNTAYCLWLYTFSLLPSNLLLFWSFFLEMIYCQKSSVMIQ